MDKDLIFVLEKEDHNKERLEIILKEHQEIKFISLAGVDLIGHETEEKIPVSVFLNDIDNYLYGRAAQTDGSSVYLPGIATINNAKIDMIADLESRWIVDYNLEHIDTKLNLPVATLKIPCFLFHENKPVDSRSILNNTMKYFESELFSMIRNHPESLEFMNIKADDLKKVEITSATELEFWVKTPNNRRDIEELSASQELKEQYWSRTKGTVRTALEETLITMEKYKLYPEMGHKEVGGVKSSLNLEGTYNSIMEQLEIDWKYSSALQSADNELVVKQMVKETFRHRGLETTFLAKPIEGVAGSGEHTHIGVMLILKNGKKVNLFSAGNDHFMSRFGYASLMGILKNYEVINPFVAQSNDAFRRLKKGFEAPVAIVTSLGISTEIPSRNRTILVGVIRDVENPYATRFELRSPNPHTNTYLCITSMLLTMLDGIKYAVNNGKNEDDLLKELSKEPGESAEYLEKGRAYRSEKDVFEDFSDEEREEYFGEVPETVYENVLAFDKYPEKVQVLENGNILNEKLVNSYRLAVTKKWLLEVEYRIIPNFTNEIRDMKMVHHAETASDLDLTNWMRIRELRQMLATDKSDKPSIFTKIRKAIKSEDYKIVSDLQIEMYRLMDELRNDYRRYKRNIMDF